MEQETDYILREVKRLTTFISNLISNVSTLNSNEVESGIKETDDFIRKEWNLSFKEIISLTEFEFINRLKELPEVHLEKLAELLSEITKKINTTELENKYNKNELVNKGIFLIDNINEKSKVYSMKRMEIKNVLQQSV
jgi:hypothetical protein|tara:strand:+ start:758 stop:1171 length:414 start_codon:yes stop_codon:yes gene_type:complete